MDSSFFDKNSAKVKDLYLILEENDDILKSISKAFEEYGIVKGQIIHFKGKIKDFNLHYIQSGSLRSIKILEEKEVVKAQGEFKYDFALKQLYGRVRLIYFDPEKNKNFDGILISGKAIDGLEIVIRYVDLT